MKTAGEVHAQIDQKTAEWRQGDFVLQMDLFFVSVADMNCPITDESIETAARQAREDHKGVTDFGAVFSEIDGLVVLTQSCDIVRPCRDRPYVEVAPLVEVAPSFAVEVRRSLRPAFAYVPGAASRNLVAQLDRTMTIEKSALASWPRTQGCSTDDEARDFATALARKRARFAFPDDFVRTSEVLQKRLQDRHNKNHAEGAHLRALREIRVRAAPSWDDANVLLTFWFVREGDPAGHEPDWSSWKDKWAALFDQSGRFSIEAAICCPLDNMTARDYVESDRLDLDRLSASK